MLILLPRSGICIHILDIWVTFKRPNSCILEMYCFSLSSTIYYIFVFMYLQENKTYKKINNIKKQGNLLKT